jgi:hypothetical protein
MRWEGDNAGNKKPEAERVGQVPEFTPREWRLLEFQCWRFMNDAYWHEKAASQRNYSISYKEGDAAKFFRDAKDAELLLGKIREVIAKLKEKNT